MIMRVRYNAGQRSHIIMGAACYDVLVPIIHVTLRRDNAGVDGA